MVRFALRCCLFFALATTVLAPARAEVAARVDASVRPMTVAVLDLTPEGVAPELAASVTGLVAAELVRLRVFEVISRQDIRAMLSHELQSQALGCEGGDCSGPVGDALGVKYLVSGSLGRVGSRFALTLSLSEVARAAVVGRSSESTVDASALTELAAAAVRVMAAPLLSARQATFLLSCAEPGAVVRIDGEVVGTTPLARRSIGWGPHLLQVSKDGFVSAIEEFSVQTTGLVERQATLVPSPDFLEAWEGHARRMRLGAWLTTGAAAVAAGTALWLQSAWADGAARYESGVSAYETAGRPAAQFAALEQLRGELDDRLLTARIAGGASLLLAAGATFFWVAGPDPDRYARYRVAVGDAGDAGDAPRLRIIGPGPAGLLALEGTLP